MAPRVTFVVRGVEVYPDGKPVKAAASAPVATPLPEDFPDRELVVGTYPTLESLEDVTQEQLEELDGIGRKKAEAILDYLTQ